MNTRNEEPFRVYFMPPRTAIFNADNPDLQGWDQYDGDKSLEIPLFLSQYLDKDD